jgi:hypothetical protein
MSIAGFGTGLLGLKKLNENCGRIKFEKNLHV